jgi:uncharacterized membrane protein
MAHLQEEPIPELVTSKFSSDKKRKYCTMGPVDVVIIGFPGNKFTGGIAPAIMELVDSGTIRILDLLFVSKDAAGEVTTLEIQDLGEDLSPGLLSIDTVSAGALDLDDAREVSEDLPNNSSALLVAFENTWAARFVQEMRAADGVVIDQIRIPADVVESVVAAN